MGLPPPTIKGTEDIYEDSHGQEEDALKEDGHRTPGRRPPENFRQNKN